jgi:hypothetical protein
MFQVVVALGGFCIAMRARQIGWRLATLAVPLLGAARLSHRNPPVPGGPPDDVTPSLSRVRKASVPGQS